MSYFATEYTIHFDDTMAYGSHHFLTAFKFQCAARESLLYGDRIFDRPGVREALDSIHLFTADAYSRNLSPARLGDRVAILITLEEWGRVSARFCYRVLSQQGQPICAGFQTMICADAKSGAPMPLPEPLRMAFDDLREITEVEAEKAFRDRVLAGSESTELLFTDHVRDTARRYLSDRYPHPQVISPPPGPALPGSHQHSSQLTPVPSPDSREAWVFPGQGAFDAGLLCDRIGRCVRDCPTLRQELQQCSEIVRELIGGDPDGLLSGQVEQCNAAVRQAPDLSQVAIFLQSILGARIRGETRQPSILLGHSFGEIAALSVACCFDLLTGVRIVCERVRAIRQHAPPGGGLLVVTADRPTVAEEIAVLGLSDVVIAGRNHERQSVVSGPRDRLEQLRVHLQTMRVQAIGIESATCFHHPSLLDAAGAWLQELRKLPIDPPNITVYSPIGRRMLTQHDDLASVLSSQFVRPFDLQGAIEDLRAAGMATIVDCGSTGSLRRLIQACDSRSMAVISVEAKPVEQELPAFEKQPDFRFRSTRETFKHPPVAIVGQGCLLPGGASSPAALHAAILEGRSGIHDLRELDPDWEQDFYSSTLVPDRSTSPLAGLVDDQDIRVPDGVDAEVFARFSRAQKLLCVAITPCKAVLKQSERVLCLVGATADGFQDQDRFAAVRHAVGNILDADVLERLGEADAAGLDPYTAIREVFDHVIGPGLRLTLVDAACASSLYAVALGMRALEDNEADVVLAGGVYCPGPGNNCLFSQFGGLTATGCRPFDAVADGVVFSEGAAFVALRRLDDARRSGQAVLAVVRGAGLSSDGRSSSANVPQTAGQLLAVQRCYENYGIAPQSIVAIEGHGTSTPVGDATEIKSLQQFFADHVSRPLPLHSLKGLLGHTGWAAGTASLIASCEALRTGIFPAQAYFRHPSPTLAAASSTLAVPTQPLRLPRQGAAIAIDGFGFGGANAHLVVERDVESIAAADHPDHPVADRRDSADDEIVIVQYHHLAAGPWTWSRDGIETRQFDRREMPLPQGVLLLPDLQDDMDVSQRLSLVAVGQTLDKLDGFDDELRRHTAIVLAFRGKTERAVEATLRVLAPRLERELSGLAAEEAIREAERGARPSGPYTLQCMMPNVAAGRAALQFNLNGPNFVVDAGPQSLEAAFASAQLLLRGGEQGGTKLVVVADIQANQSAARPADPSSGNTEYAAAFAITTARYARELGLTVLCPLEAVVGHDEHVVAEVKLERIIQGIEQAMGKEKLNDAFPERDEFPIHVPEWIDAPRDGVLADRGPSRSERWVVVTTGEAGSIEELLRELPGCCSQFLVVLTGPDGPSAAIGISDPRVVGMDVSTEESARPILSRIADFAPDVVVCLDRPGSWDIRETLHAVSRNHVGESLFLVMRQLSGRLRKGEIEVWGLSPGAWRDVVHPCTGAMSGLLKATQREFPHARLGSICCRSDLLGPCLRDFMVERRSERFEPEVAMDGDRRLVRRLRANPDDGGSFNPAKPLITLSSNSVVLATGGARGVTAVLVEGLIREFGCSVAMLGRSPLEAGPVDFDSGETERAFYEKFVAEHPQAPPTEMRRRFMEASARWEASRTLDRLAEYRGRVRYLVSDVTDREEVDEAVARVAEEFGRVDLILHGAGVQWSKRIEDRTLDEFRATFSVKVEGLRHLVDSCYARFGRVVPVHVLSSAYSIFGNDGQHDYGAANETLDRLCGMTWLSQESRWSSIAWPAWDGIGMTRGSEYRALAERRNLALLGPAAGQRILRTVLAGRTSSGINVPLSAAERTRYRIRTLPKVAVTLPRDGRKTPAATSVVEGVTGRNAIAQERGGHTVSKVTVTLPRDGRKTPAATNVVEGVTGRNAIAQERDRCTVRNVAVTLPRDGRETPAAINKGVAGRNAIAQERDCYTVRTTEFSLRLADEECLSFHKARGTPTLPGAWILDHMVQVAVRLSRAAVPYFMVEGMTFQRFVRCHGDHLLDVRMIVDESSEGHLMRMIGNIVNPAGIVLTSD